LINIKWVIADSESSDGTSELIASLSTANAIENLQVIHLVRKDNGMYDAINYVFNSYSEACDWIGWINADDYFSQNCFRDLALINKFAHIGFVTGYRQIANQNTGVIEVFCDQNISSKSLSMGLHDGIHGPYMQQEGTFFRKELWTSFKGKDIFCSLRMAGDWFLWQELAKKTQIYQNVRGMGIFCRRAGQLSENINSYTEEIDSLVSMATRSEASANTKHFEASYLIAKNGSIFLASNRIWLKK
jgi:glycosyltransferase involved in cell wall biosynthesis